MRGWLAFVIVAALALAHASRADRFTVIVLPDTQHYSEQYPELYVAQTEWIHANSDALNIRFTTHLGDVVNVGTEPDQLYQWTNARAAMDVLDVNDRPNGVCCGNHDIWGSSGGGWTGGGYDPTGANFLEYFGPQRYADKTWYRGASPSGLSSFQVVEAGGRELLFIHLLVETPAAELAWAQGVLNAHRDKPTLISTHRYLFDWFVLGAGRYGEFNYAFEPLYRDDGIQAEDFWNNFLRVNKQIYMIHCGHNAGEYRQISTNAYGLPVQEILADFQEFYGMGGNAYLRIMDFDTDNDQISVRTYSPYLNQYLTGDESEFTLSVDLDAYVDPTTNALRFQDGVGDYDATIDTWISEASKSASYGGNSILRIDDDVNNGWFSDEQGQALIRFDDLFQPAVVEGDPAPTRIPLGATIVSANLTINLTDDTEIGNPEFYVHRMLRDWDGASTWNSLSSGIVVGDDCDAVRLATFNGDNNPDADFHRTVAVTSGVQAWSDGAPNYGFAVLPQRLTGNDDGIDVRSSEDGDAVLRPALDVQFTYNPINVAPSITASLRASETDVGEGREIEFTIGAADPNSLDPLTFRMNGLDVGFATGSGTITHRAVMADEGDVVYDAEVEDDEASVAAGSVTIRVSNLPPTISAITVEPSVILIGETATFSASASDPGPADLLELAWDLDEDGAGDDWIGAEGSLAGTEPGERMLNVVVSDGDGGFATGSVSLRVRCLLTDLNYDAQIDISDAGILLSDFGCVASRCDGDVDGDGDCDLSDLGLLLAEFGTACP